MPRVIGDELQFIYKCDPTRVLDDGMRTLVETTPAIAAAEFKGGSQAIPFDACPWHGTRGGWLVLIHEVRERISDGWRDYRRRFVWFDEASVLRGVSRPFYFSKPGIEFAVGLAWHPDGKRLLISYGVRDSEAWIATVDAGEVRQVLEDAERLPSGTPGTGRSLDVSFREKKGGSSESDLVHDVLDKDPIPGGSLVDRTEKSLRDPLSSESPLRGETGRRGSSQPGYILLTEPLCISTKLPESCGTARSRTARRTFSS
jgi:hypothetical protein